MMQFTCNWLLINIISVLLYVTLNIYIKMNIKIHWEHGPSLLLAKIFEVYEFKLKLVRKLFS